ncbi:class I SAM-dependent methyltransferase [Vitiosangium sp. GDMCC 1.1324]|uniref:class I SAM-dependent methyltransferase n=1 Tax=Vitiosangium sp. (strain GDMCC 1.1324) TaxID=2138576 RepID=UPI000D3D4927|nr:class I SAM-dependent methyltransferase [Vitiosangium sp. GDMCC 1.1324]PTL77857.1 SAM-dependent methyltransferase [Vitiosangium sp. GDMCC 1.1324]
MTTGDQDSGAAVGMFENRLRKNVRHFRKWAKSRGLTAFRVYDRDVPEYSYAVDLYGDRVHLVEYPRRRALKSLEEQRTEVLAAVTAVLEVPPEHIHVKTHLPQPWGRSQYGRVGEGTERLVVEEQGLKFWVNLGDYLDTGLFMDHRVTRARVRDEARGKRFLNLFCYTGAFTVYAAAGGAARTLSVDLSNTYLDWAEENLALNGLSDPRHTLLRADAMAWVQAQRASPEETFELIVCDPPSFSTSKKMQGSFNVQRDHVRMLEGIRELLSPGGVLYFSTNFLGFELKDSAVRGYEGVEELTPGSIPEDFQRKEIHRCWRMVAPRAARR